MKNILAFGCDKEARNEGLCETHCGDKSICPTSELPTDSSDAAYRAYAENLPGAGDHLSAERRKYFEESARFCLSPHPNFEKTRNRGSDDGYYEHRDTARMWWAFEAGICAPQAKRECADTLRMLVQVLGAGEAGANLSAGLAADNRKLRHLLFMAHGNEEHYLYGDDGVRSCNTCMIDFNVDSPDEIEQKMYNYGIRKIARLQAEGKWPPDFLKAANA